MANSTIDRCRHVAGRRNDSAGRDQVSGPDRDEVALGSRFRDGEPDAVRELYARYSRPLLTLSLRHLFDADLAKDAVQQTFLQAWRSAARFDPERSLAPWLFQICRRVCIDMLRRRREPADTIDDHGQHTALAVEGPSLERSWMAFEVRRAIEDLPPESRDIIRLIHLDGWTVQQTAELLELPLGTVKSRSFRAHKRLMSVLDHLHAPDEG